MRFLRKIRDHIRRYIISLIGLPQNGFLLIERETSSISHVGIIGYRWGCIPVYGVKHGNRQSFGDFLAGLLRKKLLSVSVHGKSGLSPIVTDALIPLKNEVGRRIDAMRADTVSLAEQTFQPFRETFLSDLIKEDRNGFRKELLERIRSASANVFIAQLKKRIAELALVVKEATTPEVRYTKKRILVTSNASALPTGTKFVFSGSGKTYYVIEQYPHVRTIGWSGEKEQGRWAFAFPYIVFVVVVGNKKKDFISLHVFYRNEPLTNTSDELFYPALPDMMHGKYEKRDLFAEACFPGTDISGNVDAVVSAALQVFWNSDFKLDVHQGNFFPLYKNKLPQIWNLKTWHAASKKNPNFVLSLPWISAGVTLEEAVEEIAKTHGAKPVQTELDIESTVGKIAEKVSKEIQETCFFLVPSWSIPDETMKKLCEAFSDSLRKYCVSLKNLSGDHVREVFTPIEEVLVGEHIAALVREAVSDPEFEKVFEVVWMGDGRK